MNAEDLSVFRDTMPLAVLLGVELVEATPDRVRARLEWARELCTIGNVMHGGAIMALADTGGGVGAVLNLPSGATATTTIESKTNFLRAIQSGTVIATTTPLHKGRTMIVVETEIRRDDDRLAAKVTLVDRHQTPRESRAPEGLAGEPMASRSAASGTLPQVRANGDQRDAAHQGPGRGSGRPLDENVDQAILAATWELLLEVGYARMSIAGVAERAQVGRPAIYRRYRDKSELVGAVIADKVARVPPVDTGNTRDDLIAYVDFARRRFAVTLAGTLIVEERKHPELLDQFRDGMLVPRQNEIAAALERGKERGEVRSDLDSQLAAHALMGSFIFHYLATGRPPKGWSERVVDMLWPAFAA